MPNDFEVFLHLPLSSRVPVLVMPPFPSDPSDDLIQWFSECRNVFIYLQKLMHTAYLKRLDRLHEIAAKAGEVLWWPFTQHKLVPTETVTVIDSRLGENFSVHKVRVSLSIFSENFSLVPKLLYWHQ